MALPPRGLTGSVKLCYVTEAERRGQELGARTVSVLIVRARTVSVEIVSVLMISVLMGGTPTMEGRRCSYAETPRQFFFSRPTPFPQHM